jgi:hypothetical protein
VTNTLAYWAKSNEENEVSVMNRAQSPVKFKQFTAKANKTLHALWLATVVSYTREMLSFIYY